MPNAVHRLRIWHGNTTLHDTLLGVAGDHARGAGRYFLPKAGWHNALAQPAPGRRPAARPSASVATTAGVRMGMRAARRVSYSGTLARGHFAGTPARSLHARGAVAPDDSFRLPALGAITRRAEGG
jgi:hypothetical protein